MVSVFLISIRRGRAIAETLDFSLTSTVSLRRKGFGDLEGRFYAVFVEDLFAFCDPPRIVGVRIGSERRFQIGALPSFLKAELLETVFCWNMFNSFPYDFQAF
jgi:hypothetical protein